MTRTVRHLLCVDLLKTKNFMIIVENNLKSLSIQGLNDFSDSRVFYQI